jgi:Flp pilus assembly protein TadB
MVVIVVGSALGWAYRESERAEQAASRLAQAQQRIERQLAGARLSASDRELLDALHEQAEAQRQQEAGQ